MATKLFIGSLPYSTTSEELKELFAKAGQVVEANVVMDKMSGRSRGFGFVEMASEEDAKKAIAELNGADVDGRKIFVSEARPQRQDTGPAKQDSVEQSAEQPAADADSGDSQPEEAGEEKK